MMRENCEKEAIILDFGIWNEHGNAGLLRTVSLTLKVWVWPNSINWVAANADNGSRGPSQSQPMKCCGYFDVGALSLVAFASRYNQLGITRPDHRTVQF